MGKIAIHRPLALAAILLASSGCAMLGGNVKGSFTCPPDFQGGKQRGGAVGADPRDGVSQRSTAEQVGLLVLQHATRLGEEPRDLLGGGL